VAKKKTLRVLIVDDDCCLRELLEEGVREWGYKVAIASTGEEALERLSCEKYHVVVCDLKMPGMGGLSLLKAIKAYDESINVIIVTGYATLDTAVKAMKAGACEYLTKPFRLEELMLILKNVSNGVDVGKGGVKLHEKLNKSHGELDVMRALQRSSAEEGSE